MYFEWDEQKRELNLEKHGVDFLDAALIFEDDVMSFIDGRRNYGETRYVSFGVADGTFYTVVHTERNGRIRLISAWKGGRKDYERYKESFP